MLPYIAAPWILWVSELMTTLCPEKESDHLIRLQGNVCSSQLGPYNLRHPVPTSSLGLEAAAAPLDSTRRRHIQPYGGFVKCGILNTIDFNTSLISCWITWGTPMTWYLHMFFSGKETWEFMHEYSIGIATLGFDNWKRQHKGSLLRYIQCEPYLLDAPNQNYWASKIIRQTFVKHAFNFALLMVILGRTTNKPPEIGKYHLFYHIRYLRLLEEYIPIHFYYRVCGISMYSITV